MYARAAVGGVSALKPWGHVMFTFNDPEDELVFALFLPCGTVIVVCVAALLLPLACCYWVTRALRRAPRSLAAAARSFSALAIPDTRGDRVVF